MSLTMKTAGFLKAEIGGPVAQRTTHRLEMILGSWEETFRLAIAHLDLELHHSRKIWTPQNMRQLDDTNFCACVVHTITPAFAVAVADTLISQRAEVILVLTDRVLTPTEKTFLDIPLSAKQNPEGIAVEPSRTRTHSVLQILEATTPDTNDLQEQLHQLMQDVLTDVITPRDDRPT
jgi:hypothetical protein